MSQPFPLPPAPLEDPVIDEVRRRRFEISASVGHDIRKLGERLREIERRYADRIGTPQCAPVTRKSA